MTKKPSVDYYECDRCGACCEHSIVQADLVDALREPRIIAECELQYGYGKLDIADASFSVAIGRAKPCPFEGRDASGLHTCSIYATRPSECVEFQAGSVRCQEFRADAGLPRLKSKRRPATVFVQIHVLARDGEDE